MLEQIAKVLAVAFYAYASMGMVFAIVFVTVGLKRMDEQAIGTGVGFRLLIFPGCVAFWPMLLRRWLAGKTQPPEEENPHR